MVHPTAAGSGVAEGGCWCNSSRRFGLLISWEPALALESVCLACMWVQEKGLLSVEMLGVVTAAEWVNRWVPVWGAVYLGCLFWWDETKVLVRWAPVWGLRPSKSGVTFSWVLKLAVASVCL